MKHIQIDRGVLVRALSFTETKEELPQVYEISCGKVDFSFIDVYRDNDFIGLKWLRNLKYRRFVRILGTLDVENLYFFERREIGESHP